MENMNTKAALYLISLGMHICPVAAGAKNPITPHGFNDAVCDEKMAHKWFDGRNDLNIGIQCAFSGLLVIDIDCKGAVDGMETVRAWEREHGELPETWTVETPTGGCHLYYRYTRADIASKAFDDKGVDIRCVGGMVVAPPSSTKAGMYSWDIHPEDMPLSEADDRVLQFVRFIIGTEQEYLEKLNYTNCDITSDVPRGKRDETLYKYACRLQSLGKPDEEIYTSVAHKNAKYCKPPLSDSIVKSKVRSALTKKKGNSNSTSKRSNRMQTVGDALINEYNVCFIDDVPAIWCDNHYETGWTNIERKMRQIEKNIRLSDKREIKDYISDIAPRNHAEQPHIIAFNNCVFDVSTLKRIDAPEPDRYITNIIPHDLDDEATSDTVDEFFNGIACGDSTIITNLKEVMGLCIYRSNKFELSPILKGVGANGKSTYIEFLRNVIGEQNTSSLDLEILGQRFQSGQLVGKLANLGDDVSNEYLNGSILSVFKKISAGGRIYTDVKGSNGFEFVPYCTLIFSMNNMPRLGDNTKGMIRRFFPIPFDADFEHTGDIHMRDKLATEEACKAGCVYAVQGLHNLLANKAFSTNEYSERMKEAIRIDNDSILQWIVFEGLTLSDLEDKPMSQLHAKWKAWAIESGLGPMGITKFSRHFTEVFRNCSACVPHVPHSWIFYTNKERAHGFDNPCSVLKVRKK